MSQIGERLRELRMKRGMSATEAANYLNVSPSTYRDWENGRQIKGEPYEKIAKLFQVSINYLLTGKVLDIEPSLIEIEKNIKMIRSLL